jgi:hypothetical protein
MIAWNPETQTNEHVFKTCRGVDVNMFLMTQVNLKKCLQRVFSTTDDTLVMVESHLFGGLHNYLNMMRDSVEQAAERMKHGKDVENYTVTPLMRRIVKGMVRGHFAPP